MNIDRNKITDWVIYKIESPSGKIYIGLTSNFNNRMYSYKKAACTKQPLLHKSLKKYGYENHNVTIIDKFTSNIKYAHSKEMFWIRTFMSNFSKWKLSHGLNLTDGGEGLIGAVVSEETRKAQSIRMKGKVSPFKGKKWSELDKKRIGDSKRGNTYSVGKKRTQEQKDGQSKRMKGNTFTKGKKFGDAWNKGMKGVVKSKYKGVPRTDEVREKISNKLKGHSYNKGIKLSEEHKNNIRKSALNRVKPNRQSAVIYLGTLENPCYKEYDSLKLASDDTGINRSMVSYYAKGKCKKPNHIFKYKKELDFTKVYIPRRIFKQQEIKTA